MIIQNDKNELYICGSDLCSLSIVFGLCDRNIFEKVEENFDKIKMIACGTYLTIIQNEKNETYVYGDNRYGQLGLGDKKDRDKFEKVECDFGGIKKTVCGEYYIVIQNEKNEIYACGWNSSGQLGLGDNNDRNKFEKVTQNFGEIKNIACGRNHTIIQNEKNEIYVCGFNGYGQLGLGDKKHRYKYEKVNFEFGDIKNIACGVDYTVILNEKNDVYVCGTNYSGQLGLGDGKSIDKFEKVNYDLGEIKNISCGAHHTIIQNEKNEIYVCGYNGSGQLGLGDNEMRKKFEKVNYDFGEIKNISCGGNYTVIQNVKNEVYVCGDNCAGQLGLGDNISRNIFEKVNTDDIFEKIYNFGLKLNAEEIDL